MYLCVYVVHEYVYACVQVYVNMHIHRGQRRTYQVSSYMILH